MAASPLFFNLLEKTLLATLPALGFGMMFNVPPQTLKYCAMGAASGYGARFLLLHWGLDIEWASLFAAMMIGAMGVFWSQQTLSHPKVFTVAAVIPMIPGVYGFKAMIALVEINRSGYTPELWAGTLDNLIHACFIIAALAVGLAMPGLLIYRHKPVV
ncbi:threonine/serine exporter family protein [Desulforhopalus vacuolatus]|uniref:threonine/serine exporter family protein n=1 Tax=Desulforhopalus vacuolatus TaxID=40414 RepID=UPI003F6D5FCF